jgi:hypothetical protein
MLWGMKNANAQALGRLGGLARAKKLTAEQRKASSDHANQVKRKKQIVRERL